MEYLNKIVLERIELGHGVGDFEKGSGSRSCFALGWMLSRYWGHSMIRYQ